MRIRPESPADFAPLHDFVRTAFATAERADGDEQNFVDRLRASADYVPELALVMENDEDSEDAGKIVGHVMLTKASVEAEDGTPWGILILAPLSVALEERGRGHGSALARESLRRAAEMGFEAVAVVGEPAYYTRFGFQDAAAFHITYPGVPAPYLMITELKPGALRGRAGVVRCAADTGSH